MLFLQKIEQDMIDLRSRKTETIVYAVIWLLVISVCLLDVMRARSYTSQPLLDWSVIAHMTVKLLPFVALFLINNCLLIPSLLLRNKYLAYFITTAVTIGIVWSFQYFEFIREIGMRGMHHRGPMPPFKPLIALPVLLDFTYDILIVGVNLATALIFQRYKDKFERESLMKANAESQLTYLKAQINPHFYMNMLNNIHGMIEIDPVKAQDMVLDMSKLMRYMLYDSSKPIIGLGEELAFLKNYLFIMRQRFPESKVRISMDLPPEGSVSGIKIPPLMFLVFIENAFKHGVSYREDSFVAVKVEIAENMVIFNCLNSIHLQAENKPVGIGLKNAEQRLKLIYGSDYNLDIRRDQSVYSVTLTIPSNENKNIGN